MKIKTKLSLGLFFLFSVIVLLTLLGTIYIIRLSDESKEILVDNYRSLEYVDEMLMALDARDSVKFNASLARQGDNITEAEENSYTDSLKWAYLQWRTTPNDSLLARVRPYLYHIAEINRKAILRKSAIASATAKEATVWIGIVGAICFIVSFTLIVNFPGYIANPISQLTESIKAIANRKYEERLTFDNKDEFGELATAFNSMSSKLEEYENSNLARLLSEKKRIETLISRMHNPIIGLDENKSVIFINKEAEEILSVKAETMLGKQVHELEGVNDLFRALVADLNAAPDKDNTPLKIFSHGKENFYTREIIRVTTVPTGEKEEQFIGHVILLNDITTFRERDLAKTNFLATISHELKTPISSLQMCTKLIQDERIGTLNNEQKNILQTFAEETTRLSKITNELLDLTQVETGNIKLRLKPVQPTAIIDFAKEAVKVQAERKNTTIELQGDKMLPLIQVDLDKTTWVMINLLTNAIRYSAENSSVIINCTATHDHVRFVVEDNGIGIESKYLGKVFDRFFQVPGSPQGSGIGLAIAKEFIEAQGGKIFAESEFGKGSRFGFEVAAIT